MRRLIRSTRRLESGGIKHVTRQSTDASLGRTVVRPCSRRYMFMKHFLVSGFLLLASSAHAAEAKLCDEVKPTSENQMPVREDAFSHDNAVRSANMLVQYLQESEKHDMFFSQDYSDDYDMFVKKAVISIEGYALRKRASASQAKDAIQKFCSFLATEAQELK